MGRPTGPSNSGPVIVGSGNPTKWCAIKYFATQARYEEDARNMVANWTNLKVHQTQMAMTGPFIGFGRLCGMELSEEDLISARDHLDSWIASAGRKRKQIMADC